MATEARGGAFAAFLAIFALDAGGAVGLLIHLVPTFVVLAAIAAAWRREADRRLRPASGQSKAIAACPYLP